MFSVVGAVRVVGVVAVAGVVQLSRSGQSGHGMSLYS